MPLRSPSGRARIAVQSIVAGMALSGVAMAVAAFGWLPPVAGALIQEGIDVAVILNALRALGPGRHWGRTLMPRSGSFGVAAGARGPRKKRSTGCARSPMRWMMPIPRERWP